MLSHPNAQVREWMGHPAFNLAENIPVKKVNRPARGHLTGRFCFEAAV
jgi:hypothetical protein